MWDVLLWLYVVNATLLIVHESDSAFWQEWKLFKLPGGMAGFLALHLPLVGVVLWGLVLVVRQAYAGLILSLLLALAGLFAFLIHLAFIKKGHPEFRAPCPWPY
ncbi:MAG: hypothetical protein JRJ59_09025 [Deltaproteobacteria bacterium]|nr:hypothetical protein [Deltaproteobacteria bacterium]